MTVLGHSQKHDYIWHFGGPSPYASIFDFNYSNDSIYTINASISIGDFNASICDKNGRLFMASNGNVIIDSTGNIMQNGDSINPGFIRDLHPSDYPLYQGGLILPQPDEDSLFQFFHLWGDTGGVTNQIEKLYLTTINKNLNNGKGGVLQKNIPILEDTLFNAAITACKHANGIDWWIIQPEVYSNGIYRFLLTKDSLYGPYHQQIGQTFDRAAQSQATFSPDGTKYAIYSTYFDLDIFDFDRCTGLFSNYQHIPIQDSADVVGGPQGGGVIFSPSSQYLYVSSRFMVYQFDMQATNITTSKDTVAIYDGSYQNISPFVDPNWFFLGTLAPNGKIYIKTYNTHYLHVIHHPDSAGTASNLVQHEILISTGIKGGMPNFPHYRTPPLPSGACDSVTAVAAVTKQQAIDLYPNPTTKGFVLQWSYDNANKNRKVIIYNNLGQLVWQQSINNREMYIHTEKLAAGLYHCSFWEDGKIQSTKKLIISKE